MKLKETQVKLLAASGLAACSSRTEKVVSIRIESIPTAVRKLLFDSCGLLSCVKNIICDGARQKLVWPRPNAQLAEAETVNPPHKLFLTPQVYLNFTTTSPHHNPQNHICAYAIRGRSHSQKTKSCCSPFIKISYESSREVVVNQRIQRVCETAQVSVSVSIARAGLRTEVDPPFLSQSKTLLQL